MSLGLSFGYIFLMRLPAILSALIWSSILVSIGMFVAAGYYAYQLADDWRNAQPQIQDDRTINVTTAVAVTLWVVGGLMVLITCCLRKQIVLAVGSVKEAGRAVNKMPLILAVPVLQAIGFIVFITLFLFYGVNLASLGEISTQDVPVAIQGGTEIAYRVYEFDSFIEYCAWFLLFCLFWTSNFIVALGDMIIAMAVSRWYFTRDKKFVGSSTVLRSIAAVSIFP